MPPSGSRNSDIAAWPGRRQRAFGRQRPGPVERWDHPADADDGPGTRAGAAILFYDALLYVDSTDLETSLVDWLKPNESVFGWEHHDGYVPTLLFFNVLTTLMLHGFVPETLLEHLAILSAHGNPRFTPCLCRAPTKLIVFVKFCVADFDDLVASLGITTQIKEHVARHIRVVFPVAAIERRVVCPFCLFSTKSAGEAVKLESVRRFRTTPCASASTTTTATPPPSTATITSRSVTSHRT